MPKKYQVSFILAQILIELKKDGDDALVYANKALAENPTDERT